MKKKFNIKDYNRDVAIYCSTKDEITIVANHLKKLGVDTGRIITVVPTFAHKFCYIFVTKPYKSLKHNNKNYIEHVYCSDFDWRNDVEDFTFDKLQDGDFIIERCGRISIVLPSKNIKLNSNGRCQTLDYKSDLAHLENENYDIMKVFRPSNPLHFQFSCNAFRCGERLYNREESVELTIEQIEKKLNIKHLKVIE